MLGLVRRGAFAMALMTIPFVSMMLVSVGVRSIATGKSPIS